MDAADSFSLLKTYLDEKLDTLREEIKEDVEEKAVKRRKVDSTESFKHKSNIIQYKFNLEQQELAEDIMKLISKGAVNRPKRKLEKLIQNLEKRNKLIRIAEKSPGGWATVAEYETDEMASDEEDEKRIRNAEKRAMEKKEKLFKQRKQRPSSTTTKRDDHSSGRHRPAPNREKPTDICLGCGQYGHWRYNCPERHGKQYKRKQFE